MNSLLCEYSLTLFRLHTARLFSTHRLVFCNPASVTQERGIRRGCKLSANIYSEHIFREALDKINEGILLNGERMNNIRYAEDIGHNNTDDRVREKIQRYGLEINVNKTKLMVVSEINIIIN